jgi:hypothetical protein
VGAPRRREPAPSVNLRSTALPTQPFQGAQQQAQRRVVAAQKRLPKEPTPHIPRLANPTPAQAHEALSVAQAHQRASGKPAVTYWRELRNDPRQRDYIRTVEHYAHAAQGHLDAQVGRTLGAREHAAEAGRRFLAEGPRSTARPAPAPKDIGLPLFGFGTVRVPGTAHIVGGLSHLLASITPGLRGNTPETAFVRNFANDAVSVGELPVLGGYQFVGAGLHALTGDLGPAKRLASGVAQGVEHGAAGQLVQGNFAGAERAVREHPLFSALEALGASGVAGRTAGALARGIGSDVEAEGLRGAAARLGSQVRPPVALVDDAGAARQGLVRQRTYSPDLIRKAAQVLVDKRRAPVLDASGAPVRISDRGRTVPVLKPRERLLRSEEESLAKRRGNFESSRTQAVEHVERENVRKAVNAIEQHRRTRLPELKGAISKELVHLVATGTLRNADTFRADLEAHAKRAEGALKNPGQFRTRAELKAAQGNARLLRAALNSPRVTMQIPTIVQQGLRVAELRKAMDERLIGLHVHPRDELERAALSEYALAHMGAAHDGEALRGANGQPLTNGQIRTHAEANGRNPDTLAHFPHVIEAGDKRAYHRAFRISSRPVPAHVSRTGALFHRGSAAFGREVVRDALTRSSTTANLAEAIDRFAHEAGLRKPNGAHFTAAEAVEAANRFQDEGGEPRFVPMRAFGATLPKGTRTLIADAQSSAQMETAHQRLLNSRTLTEADRSDRTPNAVLVPKHLHDALAEQLTPAGALERRVQLLNAPFRMAVLPQPRWLTGNFIEPYLVRLPLVGAGVVNLPGAALDIAAGRKALNVMERSGDPAQVRAAKEIRAQQFGGLFIGRRGASVRRTYQDFGGTTGKVLYGAHVLRNLPAVKQFGDLALSLPHGFFHVNRVIESVAQQQAFGKSVRRDVQQFTGKWSQTVVLGQRALEDVGKGLVNTAAQHRFMEAQYELLGQYDGFNPALRKLVQTVAPFLPWTLASLRFVFWTLPAHHTATFVALAKAAQTVQADWEREHADVPPGTLKYALLGKDGGLTDVARYTPYGATIPPVQGDLSQLTDTILPQISGSVHALQGQDPFGRELQVPKTPGNPEGKATGAQKAEIALNSLFEAMVPLVAQGRRLREGGGTAYANSTVFSPKAKPGTSHMSALRRTFDPFRPTYLKQPKGAGDPYVRQEVARAKSEAQAMLKDPYIRREIEEAKAAAK